MGLEVSGKSGVRPQHDHTVVAVELTDIDGGQDRRKPKTWLHLVETRQKPSIRALATAVHICCHGGGSHHGIESI